jgi:hypothetical protein
VSKTLRLGLTGALAAMLLAGAPAAGAKDGDIIRQGSCSGATDWKLKLSPENGRIEVEFEVDQNKVGRRWTVALKRNGVRFFKGPRVTHGPSGSFELRRVAKNGRGPDRFVAKARNWRSGERCKGWATF